MPGRQPLEGGGPAGCPVAEIRLELADRGPDRPAELERPPDRIAVPERELARDSGRGLDGHPVVADLEHPPGAGSEHDHVAVHPGPKLVDHLLVQLADPPAGRARVADDEHPEQPPIGNRAPRRHGHDPRIAPSLDRARHPVPGDPRLQLGELVGGIGAGEHRQDALEGLPRQRFVRQGPADRRSQLVDRPAIHHGHRHDLLGQDIERIARDLGRLDRPGMHPLGHDRRLEQVAPVLREDHPFRRRVHLVAGPADPLEAAGDRGRRFDLDHEVDRAHVDPQLEAGGGDDRRQAARLEVVLDRQALLAGDRAVVRPDQLLAGQLVQALGEPLGQAPAVAEDDRAPMGPDQLEDPGMDRGPDADPQVARCAGPAERAGGPLLERNALAEPAHVLDRDDDRQLEGLARAGVDDSDLAAWADATEESGDQLERPLGGRQPDPLGRLARQPLETLEAEGQVGPPLRAGDRVDLVDDHVLDPGQAGPGRAGQEQVERLGGRDQDVGRPPGGGPTFFRTRVAGAQADRDLGDRITAQAGGPGDPGQRRAQVALDVVGQGLERRHVQDPDEPGLLAGRRRARFADEPVEAPQERGQGLAAAGRGVDQGVPAGRDRGPAPGLGRGRGGERRLEPVANGRAECRQGLVHGRVEGGRSEGR